MTTESSLASPPRQRGIKEPGEEGQGDGGLASLSQEEIMEQVRSILAPQEARLVPQAERIEASLRVFAEPGQTVEVRARWGDLNGIPGHARSMCGSYDDLPSLAMQGARWESLYPRATAVYFTLNSVHPSLAGTTKSAKDKDILRRRWLLIDADPVRPADTNATVEEKAHAEALIGQVRDFLRGEGFPEPVRCDSGNGYHLLYRIELPNDEEATTLVRRVLAALGEQFDRPGMVVIDRKVFNASRISKLYGTLSRKGENTPDRPHRYSAILEVPAELVPVWPELLERLAATAPADVPAAPPGPPEGEGQPSTERAAKLTAPYDGQRTKLTEKVRRRVAAYIEKVPPAISGQGGHNATFALACKLVLWFNLNPEDALEMMKPWNEECKPPWSEKELRHKVEEADKVAGERGILLGDKEEKEGQPATSQANQLARAAGGQIKKRSFPPPVPISHLATTAGSELEWFWHGYIPERSVVLLTALWKSGKTTLLTHLLKAVSQGQTSFLGHLLRPGKVLIITQESDAIWAERLREHDLSPERIYFQRGNDDNPRPFWGKPGRGAWKSLVKHLEEVVREGGFKLVVIDPLSDFWPVRDENAAGEVTEALVPLRRLADAGASVLILHHPRKSGGNEGTAHRGSGQLAAFADVLLELSRSDRTNMKDCRRVLRAQSRHSQTPAEVTIQLTAEGYQVVSQGEGSPPRRAKDREADRLTCLGRMLPDGPPGRSVVELLQDWPKRSGTDDSTRRELSKLLRAGEKNGLWQHSGTGRKNDPKRYFRSPSPPSTGTQGEGSGAH
jgi:hypothetical protein